jgi:predicted nucleic acid-binding protein
VSGVVADTSVWIDFLTGRAVPALEESLEQGLVVLPPLVVAELVSGARRPRDRAAIADLVGDLPWHETPLEHWVRVGELRRRSGRRESRSPRPMLTSPSALSTATQCCCRGTRSSAASPATPA